MWFVQVSSFPQAQDAEILAKKLREKGYDAYVAPADVNGKNWHRVRVGRFADREAANEAQKALKGTEKLEQSFVLSRY
jgi:cell division septation protein DedD